MLIDTLLIVGMLLLLGVATIYEMAIFSVRQEHMRHCSHQGDRRGTIVMTFIRNPARIISGLQLFAVAIGLGLGMQLQAAVLGPVVDYLTTGPLSQTIAKPYASTIGYWAVLATFTLLTLVFTNVLPKKIAYALGDSISLKGARAAWVFGFIVSPFANFVGAIVDAILKLLRIKLPSAPAVLEADIKILLHQGHLRGTIDPNERKIILNAFALSDIAVKEIMTPVSQIESISVLLEKEERIDQVIKAKHSILTLTGDDGKTIIGAVRAKDVLSMPDQSPWTYLMPILKLDSEMSVLGTLELFRQSRTKIGVILGEKGEFVGMITFNDVVTKLLGSVRCISE